MKTLKLQTFKIAENAEAQELLQADSKEQKTISRSVHVTIHINVTCPVSTVKKNTSNRISMHI